MKRAPDLQTASMESAEVGVAVSVWSVTFCCFPEFLIASHSSSPSPGTLWMLTVTGTGVTVVLVVLLVVVGGGIGRGGISVSNSAKSHRDKSVNALRNACQIILHVQQDHGAAYLCPSTTTSTYGRRS
jgi:hypothetical protein